MTQRSQPLSLITACLKAIAHVKLKSEHIKHLTESERIELSQYLPLDLAPELASRLIDSEDYWRRRLNDPTVKSAYKQTYLQKLLASRIETADPTTTPASLRGLAEACGPWIFELVITSTPAHIQDLSFLLETCPSLASLTATFGAKLAAVTYDRASLGMRLRDAHHFFARKAECLTRLSLPYNLIDDELVKTLVPGLMNLGKTLVYLDLSRNCIGDRGARRIAGTLQHFSALKHLDLSDNDIHAHGCMHLGQTVTPTIEVLNLTMNRVEDTGACQLLQDLSLNSTLKKLHLACNNLTIRTLPFLASFLVENTALQVLDLSGNAQLLTTEPLAVNPVLIIGENPTHSLLDGFPEEAKIFADSPVGVFVQCLRRNTALKVLDLTGTKFPLLETLQRHDSTL